MSRTDLRPAARQLSAGDLVEVQRGGDPCHAGRPRHRRRPALMSDMLASCGRRWPLNSPEKRWPCQKPPTAIRTRHEIRQTADRNGRNYGVILQSGDDAVLQAVDAGAAASQPAYRRLDGATPDLPSDCIELEGAETMGLYHELFKCRIDASGLRCDLSARRHRGRSPRKK